MYGIGIRRRIKSIFIFNMGVAQEHMVEVQEETVLILLGQSMRPN